MTIAQQVEEAFLAALESRDAEVYNLLKAGHDLRLAEATVDLQDLRITEAEGAVTLAQFQPDLAEAQERTYDEWLHAGPNEWKRDMLQNYEVARDARNWLAKVEAALPSPRRSHLHRQEALWDRG